MYQIFSRDNGLAYGLMLVVLVLLRLRQLLDPMRYALAKPAELYTPAWNACFGWAQEGGLTAIIVSLAITIVCALILNTIVDTYALTENRTALGGFFFTVLCGGTYYSLTFPPTLLFAPFLAMSVDRLYSATRKDSPSLDVFWAAVWLTSGCLFWAKGVWFLPFFLLMTMELSVASSRTVIAGGMGVVATIIVFLTIGVWATDSLDFVRQTTGAIWPAEPSRHWGYRSVIYGATLLITLVMAIVAMQQSIAQAKISQSRRLRSARWLAIFTALLLIVPNNSLEVQPVVAVGAALVLPPVLERSRANRLQEGISLLLVGITAWFIWQ